MILRVFKAVVHKERIADFKKLVQDQSIPWLRASEGMLRCMPGAPLDENKKEFTMVSLWRDLDSVKTFCGEEWDRAVITPDEEPLVERMSVEHYRYFED